MYMPSVFGDSFFDNFFEDFAFPARRASRMYIPSTNLMRTDVKENETGYELDIDMPGFDKDNIKAELKDGYLTINASTEKSEDNSKDNYIRKERYSGTCSRSFYVGEDVTENDIKAKFENGTLKLSIPKMEKKPEIEQKKYIAIEG